MIQATGLPETSAWLATGSLHPFNHGLSAEKHGAKAVLRPRSKSSTVRDPQP